MSQLSWEAIRKKVYDRANGCCEYCQTCESNIGQTMHVDHIIPDGKDELNNLCLACWNCNTSKQTATQAIDPKTNTTVALFDPRNDVWGEHFAWSDNYSILNGLTPKGRATIERLKMNRPMMIGVRQRWVKAGYHPPK